MWICEDDQEVLRSMTGDLDVLQPDADVATKRLLDALRCDVIPVLANTCHHGARRQAHQLRLHVAGDRGHRRGVLWPLRQVSGLRHAAAWELREGSNIQWERPLRRGWWRTALRAVMRVAARHSWALWMSFQQRMQRTGSLQSATRWPPARQRIHFPYRSLERAEGCACAQVGGRLESSCDLTPVGAKVYRRNF